MALLNDPAWAKDFFKTTVGLSDEKADQYSKIFVDNNITEDTLSELTRDILRELGITVLGDVLNILKKCKTTSAEPVQHTTNTSAIVKPPPPKLPVLTMEITMPQWRKFQFDWKSFKNITTLHENQIASQLYSACDETVQMSLINTVSNIFEQSEDNLLKHIESIVTQKSNPMVHRMAFR